jgi:hypothetical protein
VINPLYVQVTEMTWPVPEGWTVAFRDGNGTWTDLSRYYVPEAGATTVVVGQFNREILANSYQQVGSRPLPDSSIPATPTFSASATSAYQTALQGTSDTKAVVQLTWTTPLNTDGSTVVDGDHYEVPPSAGDDQPYPATHLQMASKHHDQLLTHQQPLIPAITDTNWRTEYVPWGTNTVLVSELTPGVNYEFQVSCRRHREPAEPLGVQRELDRAGRAGQPRAVPAGRARGGRLPGGRPGGPPARRQRRGHVQPGAGPGPPGGPRLG